MFNSKFKMVFPTNNKGTIQNSSIAKDYCFLSDVIHANREKAYKKNLSWYERSAEKGDTDAQLYLADLYYSGKEVKMDMKIAFQYYLDCAKQGNAEAQFKLANMFEKGIGVSANKNYSFHWFLKSANQGYAPAQYQIAIMYYYGNSIPKDIKIAADWMEKACNAGFEIAMEKWSELKLYQYK